MVFKFQPFSKGPRLVVGTHSIGEHLAEANGGARFNRARFGAPGVFHIEGTQGSRGLSARTKERFSPWSVVYVTVS